MEARIVALILGDASAFEEEDLAQQMEEDPELRVFKQRIEAVNGLVREAESAKPDADWKLSRSRRINVLAAIQGTTTDVVNKSEPSESSKKSWSLPLLIAGSLLCTIFLGFWLPRAFQTKNETESLIVAGSGAGGYLEDHEMLLEKVGQIPQSSPVRKPVPSPPGRSADESKLKEEIKSDRISGALEMLAEVPREENAEFETARLLSSALNTKDSFAAGKGKNERRSATRRDQLASENPFSTFSLHVSDVSFQMALSALRQSARPTPASIRVEEFINAMDYEDLLPTMEEMISCRMEQAAHPYKQGRNLVRISIRTAEEGRLPGRPLRLTLLIDRSGSMEREDRRQTLLESLRVLAGELKEGDEINLISFARTSRLIAEALPGNQPQEIVQKVAQSPASGGTNLEEALDLAGQIASKHFEPNGMNRIILISDGAANLGNADPLELVTKIVALRDTDIAFDACAIGSGKVNDSMLEQLTREGDGRYYYLDRPQDANANFVSQIAGSLRPAAEDVKVQVIFNDLRVKSYRLIGFENHRLDKEDFRDDSVDAAELAAAEEGVAMYEVELLPNGQGDIADVLVRFRDTGSRRMIERSWTMRYRHYVPSLEDAPTSMQMAALAMAVGESLAGNGQVQLDAFTQVANELRNIKGNRRRVQELLEMMERLRSH